MRIPFIPFIPVYIAVSTLIFFQAATASSVQNVSSEQNASEISVRCMMKPYEDGCTSQISKSQAALGLELAIASGQAGELHNPESNINAAIAMQQAQQAQANARAAANAAASAA